MCDAAPHCPNRLARVQADRAFARHVSVYHAWMADAARKCAADIPDADFCVPVPSEPPGDGDAPLCEALDLLHRKVAAVNARLGMLAPEFDRIRALWKSEAVAAVASLPDFPRSPAVVLATNQLRSELTPFDPVCDPRCVPPVTAPLPAAPSASPSPAHEAVSPSAESFQLPTPVVAVMGGASESAPPFAGSAVAETCSLAECEAETTAALSTLLQPFRDLDLFDFHGCLS